MEKRNHYHPAIVPGAEIGPETETAVELEVEQYLVQKAAWPKSGRHILAQFDESSVIVYQAYNPAIGRFAAEHGYLGGRFLYDRMSWIKTNFLWMMYRSGWGTKPDQEVTLALRIRREFFDELLLQAVPSGFDRDLYSNNSEWRQAVRRSNVRLQWDPDHGPRGNPVERRAIQLGLRGEVLDKYGKRAVLNITDISDFVAEQRHHAETPGQESLVTPAERVYLPADPSIVQRLQLSS